MFSYVILFLVILVASSIVGIILSKKKRYYAISISILTIILMTGVLVFFYILDINNIPTKTGMLVNINTENWFGLINGIIGATIAALVSINVVSYQIGNENKKNEENLRIQNMPLLKYEVKAEDDVQRSLTEDNIIYSKYNPQDSLPYELYLKVKNISPNTIKQLCIDFDSETVNKEIRIIGADTRISLEKDATIEDAFIILLPKDREYKMNLNGYYEDILNNWYKQKIEIQYETTTYNVNSKYKGVVYYKYKEEKRMELKEVYNLDLK